LPWGNFDGVHLGHQALFAEAGRLAEAHEASVVAVTFDVHPLAVLRPGTEPPTILHRDQRAAALRAAGADRVDWLEADASLLKLEPREFLAMMVERYRPLAMVEGTNFRFGKGRQGGPENLPDMAATMGFEARIAPLSTVTLRDKTVVDVSSSLVRWLIGRGRMADVALCLGRPLMLRGTVVEGEKRGRTIGYPTLNLDCGRQMLPCDGVYGASISIDGRAHAAAVSIGPQAHVRLDEADLRSARARLLGRPVWRNGGPGDASVGARPAKVPRRGRPAAATAGGHPDRAPVVECRYAGGGGVGHMLRTDAACRRLSHR
jgi:riboflavin kinase/FMN adenylyltransferase